MVVSRPQSVYSAAENTNTGMDPSSMASYNMKVAGNVPLGATVKLELADNFLDTIVSFLIKSRIF